MSKFSTIFKDVAKGAVLKPLVHSYLYNAEWPEDFNVRFHKGSSYRPPDPHFHPSQHPTWPDRMLFYYLTQPDKMIRSDMEYMDTLSVTVGTALHGFMETCLKHLGVLLDDDELRSLGFEVANGEPRVSDDETGAQGSMDGVVRIHVPTDPDNDLHHFEFKTSSEWALSKIEDLDLDAFKARWPYYYAQAQEYLRMSRFTSSVVLMMQVGRPWALKEFHIPRSEQFISDTREKYLRVRQAVSLGELPPPCCSPRSAQAKACPARGICPVGLA